MKRILIVALAALAALSLAGCDLFDTVDEAECAAVIQQAVLRGTREVSSSALPMGAMATSKALVAGVEVTIRNPEGGRAVYTCALNEDGTQTIHFEFTDWYVKDGDEEYTVDGGLDMVMGQLETELGEEQTTVSMSFSTTGEMTVSQNGKSRTGAIDLTTVTTMVMDMSDMSAIEVTTTLATTGTVAGVSVDSSNTYSFTISIDY